MSYKPLQKLSPRHYEAMNMLVFGRMTEKEIAEDLGVTQKTLSAWQHDDLFLSAQDELMRQKYKNMAREAQQIILDLARNAKNENVRMSCSKDILDRSGWKPTDKTELTTGEDGFSISIDYGDTDDSKA